MENKSIFNAQVLGHPAGLFVLFFTEMWERFSFYGMRVLLINFLTMTLIGYNPGWQWSAENATALFGTYVMLLYLTPILGGMIADKYTGYRWAVIIGAVIITFGHVSMAFETEFSLYLGLALLVIGTGFFKPNMVSFVSEMYKDLPQKKDAAYTIFYMGVNSGAFFGMMLCGYLAERIGWSWGFGLAGIFMLLGTIQFWFAKSLFGNIGLRPQKQVEISKQEVKTANEEEKLNPFTVVDKVLVALSAVIGIGYALNDPLSKIWGIDLFAWASVPMLKGQYVVVIVGLLAFSYLIGSRIMRYTRVVRDRMLTVAIFAFFVIFFWLSFEQGASSLIIFARDNVTRELHGSWAVAYNIFNALLTIIPLLLISYVLFLLVKRTYKKILPAIVMLLTCFSLVWGIALWMLNRDFKTIAYEVTYQAYEVTNANGKVEYVPITESQQLPEGVKVVPQTTIIGVVDVPLKEGAAIKLLSKNKQHTSFGYVNAEKEQWAIARGKELQTDNGLIPAQVKEVRANWVEATVSWFSILNSFFIIALASLFSRWWDSKYNPPAAAKYGIGLLMLSVGFGLLALGSYGAVEGVKVSMLWLVFAYMFNTMGELCLSPVGLSYVSKLVPGRMIAFMFGVWYLAVAIGHKLAAVVGGQIENITKEYSLTTFFLIFTVVPGVAGVLIILINPFVRKLMHGVK